MPPVFSSFDKTFDGSRASAEAVGRVPEYDERARALLATLGIHDDASSRLNFAYAISAIGERRAAELHSRLGIDYFMRYSPGMLMAVYDTLNADRSDRPLLVIAFNKNDWNGAFYREGLLLDPLLRAYRPLLFETDSEGNYYSRIGEIAGRYGRISTLVVGGHGEAGAIQLGDASETGRIDLSDHDELLAAGEAQMVVGPRQVLFRQHDADSVAVVVEAVGKENH